jgi:hypothetical protein
MMVMTEQKDGEKGGDKDDDCCTRLKADMQRNSYVFVLCRRWT